MDSGKLIVAPAIQCAHAIPLSHPRMKILETVFILAGVLAIVGFVGIRLKPTVPAAKKTTKSKSMTREPN
jgi:hypothetical protein